MRTNFTNINWKVNSRKLDSIITSVKKSYDFHYNKALTQKENFILWAKDVQGIPFTAINPMFGYEDIKGETVRKIYHAAKKKRGGEKS